MSDGRVVVAVPGVGRSGLTYRVPARLPEGVARGCRVRVPLGRRQVVGYLQELDAEPPPPGVELRPVAEFLDAEPPLSAAMLELVDWVAAYYAAPWADVVRTVLQPDTGFALEREYELGDAPAAPADAVSRELVGRLGAGRQREARLLAGLPRVEARRRLAALRRSGRVRVVRVQARAEQLGRPLRTLRLADGVDPADARERCHRRPAQRAVVAALAAAGRPLTLAELTATSGASAASVRQLVRSGIAVAETRRVAPERPAPEPAAAVGEHTLTGEQAAAVHRIRAALDRGRYAAYLLAGITGSGKTEVYLRAARHAVTSGGQVLYLVPEIVLTSFLAVRLASEYGDRLAVLHSALGRAERAAAHRRAAAGEVDIVLGARSAVFTPFERLALVVVDEEHEAAYKQQDSPRYHGRDVAVLRASREEAVVVVGSATPSLESAYNAERGRYTRLELGSRATGALLPECAIVDMRAEFRRTGSESVWSEPLVAALRQTCAAGEQAVVLLNRRGYALFVLCRECGETVGCSRCSVSYTLYLKPGVLRCRYCGERRPVPEQCPSCSSRFLHRFGHGTERAVEELAAVAPELRVARLDRDTTRRRGAAGAILRRFAAGDSDVLLGTQMVAKGHDFPRVTLVGVLMADAHLAFPDVRAGERTFQLLTQVAGRAGRGSAPGRVLIQAYNADHYALRHACTHDYAGFYAKEMRFRRALGYPPLRPLAAVWVLHRDVNAAATEARRVADSLRGQRSGLRVLGPAIAPVARIKSRYRFQVLVLAPSRRVLQTCLTRTLDALPGLGVDPRHVGVDVDPVNLV